MPDGHVTVPRPPLRLVSGAEECPAADRGVDELATAQRFLLWAARQWLVQYRAGERVGGLLRDGFHHANIGDATTPFREFMTGLAGGARRPIDLRCLHCPWLSPDEAALLEAAACLQRDRQDRAGTLLAGLATSMAVRISMPRLDVVAQIMACADLIVPAPPDIATHVLRAGHPGIALMQ